MSYIKIHRKILEWEWYTDPNTFRLFIHLLINAYFETKSWQGIDIERGQIVIGRKKLSEQLKLSEREIRTSITKLKTTNKYSIVTICKYEDYQGSDKPERQSSDQQTTTTKERKERKEVKKDIYREFAHLKITVFEFNKLVEAGYSKEQIDGKLDDIENWKKNKNYSDLYKTVNNWLKKDYPEVVSKQAKTGINKTSEFDFDSLTAQRLNAIHQPN